MYKHLLCARPWARCSGYHVEHVEGFPLTWIYNLARKTVKPELIIIIIIINNLMRMLCSEGSLEACSKSIRLVSDQVGRGRVRVLELVTWEQRPKRWDAVSEAKRMGRRVTCPAATARLSVSLQLPNLSYPGNREQNHQFWSPYSPPIFLYSRGWQTAVQRSTVACYLLLNGWQVKNG